MGGVTNAQASAPEGRAATAATLTRLIAATASGAAAAHIASDALPTLGGSVLSNAAGVAQAGPTGAQVGDGRVVDGWGVGAACLRACWRLPAHL